MLRHIVLLVLAGSAVLAGCAGATPVRERTESTAAPSSTPPASVQQFITATPTFGTPECRAAGVQDRARTDRVVLSLTPGEPRRGERVRVQGQGLTPGAYSITVGVQRDLPLPRTLGNATVDTSGVLDVSVVLADLGRPADCYMIGARPTDEAKTAYWSPRFPVD